MRRGLRILAGLALAAAAVVARPGAVDAEPVTASGWWYKVKQGPAAGLMMPAPANVPDGGLYVANDPTGAAAVAALRYDGAAGAGATLTLQVAEGSNAAAAQINICPATAPWEPAESGAWDERPEADCGSMAITGVPSTEGLEVSWLVPASFTPEGATALDIVLLPVDGSPPASVAFAPPGDNALVLTSPPSDPSGAGGGVEVPSVESYSMAGSGSFEAPAYDYDGGSELTVTPPPSPAPPSAESAPSAASGGGDQVAALPAVPAAATDDSPTARITAVVTLVLIAAGLWWLSNQPARAPRLLGSLGGGGESAPRPLPVLTSERPRGIGRFARTRTAPPTRI